MTDTKDSVFGMQQTNTFETMKPDGLQEGKVKAIREDGHKIVDKASDAMEAGEKGWEFTVLGVRTDPETQAVTIAMSGLIAPDTLFKAAIEIGVRANYAPALYVAAMMGYLPQSGLAADPDGDGVSFG